jgi:hypothetical protein
VVVAIISKIEKNSPIHTKMFPKMRTIQTKLGNLVRNSFEYPIHCLYPFLSMAILFMVSKVRGFLETPLIDGNVSNSLSRLIKTLRIIV